VRVLHLLKTSSGASWALRQTRELVKLGVEVHVALPPGGSLIPSYEAAGVRVHAAPLDRLGGPLSFAAAAGAVRGLVRRVRPDLVHSHFVSTTLLARAALGPLSSTPRLFQVPGPLHLEHAATRALEIASAGRPDHWMGSCRWTCARYRRSGVPARRIHLSYYGADVDALLPKDPGKLRRELGIAVDVAVVGMVAFVYGPKRWLGQTRGLKGHEDLIDAVDLLQREGRKVALVCVGGAWAGATAYEAEVREYGRRVLGSSVRFLGTRADVADLYAGFDVAVHPSHSENVGAAVESLLAGVPTVASSVGGLTDLVIEGETGRLVPPRAPRALAKAIGRVLDDPVTARRYADAGRALARDLFDVRRTALTALAAYGQIVPGDGDMRRRAGPRP